MFFQDTNQGRQLIQKFHAVRTERSLKCNHMMHKKNEEISMRNFNEQAHLLDKSSRTKPFKCFGKKDYDPRAIYIGYNLNGYCGNAINNQKYNFFTFIPLVLYNQFKFFLNLYFLTVALTQFINQVKIGYLYTYWGPLCFVLMVTMIREAIDDFRRHQRDKEVNSSKYDKIIIDQNYNVIATERIQSSNIKVGDILLINKNQRIPADILLLQTSESNGSCFIRTDQLDGETDWKARKAISYCQTNIQNFYHNHQRPPILTDCDLKNLADTQKSKSLDIISKHDINSINQNNIPQPIFNTSIYYLPLTMKVNVEIPKKDINTFNGTFHAFSQAFTNEKSYSTLPSSSATKPDFTLQKKKNYVEKNVYSDKLTQQRLIHKENLNIEHTIWSSCILASEGSVLGLVIYTGRETRSCMNTSQPRSKVGLTDLEINQLTKILFMSVLTLSILLMVLKGFSGPWYRYFVRFILLFSYIIPISLRVNLDLAKMAYAYMITKDKDMPGNVVRNTTIPEELGRIRYLFTDKTGTLTKNEMVFKRLYLGSSGRSICWPTDADSYVNHQLKLAEQLFFSSSKKMAFDPNSLSKFPLLGVNGETPTSDYPSPNNSFYDINLSTNNNTQSSKITQTTLHSPHKQQTLLQPNYPMEQDMQPTELLDLYETVLALCICNNVTPIYTSHSQLDGQNMSENSILHKTSSQANPSSIIPRKLGQLKDTLSVLFGRNKKAMPTEYTTNLPINITTPSTNTPSIQLTNPNPSSQQQSDPNNRDSLTDSVLSNNSTCDSTSHLLSTPMYRTTNSNTNISSSTMILSPNLVNTSSSKQFQTVLPTQDLSVVVKPQQEDIITSYQASSPDEVALVTWAHKVGMKLIYRDTNSLKIETPCGQILSYKVLKLIPFSSERKMMGIIVKLDTETINGNILFYVKGADSIISKMASYSLGSNKAHSHHGLKKAFDMMHQRKRSDGIDAFNSVFDWIDEESGNLAREGLRTLVIGRNKLSQEQYQTFMNSFENASLRMGIVEKHDFDNKNDNNTNQFSTTYDLSSISSHKAEMFDENLNTDKDTNHIYQLVKGGKFEVLGITGVEDKLQDGVPHALEMLRNAGIKIWMLTGDKLETAICIAKSSHLIQRTNQSLFVFTDIGASHDISFDVEPNTSLADSGIKGEEPSNPKGKYDDQHKHKAHSFALRELVHRELVSYKGLRARESSLSNTGNSFIMTGPVLEICMTYFESEFMEAALSAHCVVICRASPTQKSRVVAAVPQFYRPSYYLHTKPHTIKHKNNSPSITTSARRTSNNVLYETNLCKRMFCCCFGCCPKHDTQTMHDGNIAPSSNDQDWCNCNAMTKCRTLAIGDGGNDVSMIQTAHVGVGIAGKEGKQASLAADFSICQFSHLTRLILVHGRYSYKRSAALSQFIIHRGLIISTMQAIFSAIFFFASVALYQGYLMIGYATIYTMFPVFSIILDRDITPQTAMMYPELYQDLVKGRALSYKTFFIWVLISIYQGSVIMFGAFLLFEDEFVHVVSITFTALIFNELLMVALTVRRWRHWAIISAEMFSLVVYLLTLVVFREQYFDRDFVLRSSLTFVWKVSVVTLISCVPLVIFKVLARKFSPPLYAKLS